MSPIDKSRFPAYHRLPQTEGSGLRKENSMKYVCKVCGYVYDPAVGDPDGNIAAGTEFKDLPEDWVCPTCGAPKSSFEPMKS